jgi:hypothetical protein
MAPGRRHRTPALQRQVEHAEDPARHGEHGHLEAGTSVGGGYGYAKGAAECRHDRSDPTV